MLALVLGLAVATALVLRARPVGSSSMLRAQVTSWWRLLPPVFVAWGLDPLGVPLLVLLISLLAAKELHGLSEQPSVPGLGPRFALLIAMQAALGAVGQGIWNVLLMLVLATLNAGAWHASGGAHRSALLQALFAAQAAGLWCMAVMAPVVPPQGEAATWFLYLCVVTALNDIGQFLIGTRFGRHKLATRISPNKTWQGFGGGLVVSAVVSMLVGHSLGLASLPWLFWMGLVLSIAGLLGDLMFSAGKRRLGVKDYGRLIPGHGGILDRVDSLVLTAPSLLLALWWA